MSRDARLLLFKLLVPSALVFCGLAWFKNAWAALLLFHGFIIVSHILEIFPKGLSSNMPKTMLPTKFIWCVLVAMPFLTYIGNVLAFSLWPFDNLGRQIESVGLTETSFLWFAGYLCLFNGTLEESYWRLLGPETPRFPYLNDLLYSLFHLPVLVLHIPILAIPIALLALFCAGAIWRIAKVQLNTLLPSILSHTACNMAIWIFLYRNIHTIE